MEWNFPEYSLVESDDLWRVATGSAIAFSFGEVTTGLPTGQARCGGPSSLISVLSALPCGQRALIN